MRRVLKRRKKGLYTYDSIPLANAHAVAQMKQCLRILLSAFAQGNVLNNEALIPPSLHGLNVKLIVFGGDVQHRRAVLERQPPIAVGEVLQRHFRGSKLRLRSRERSTVH